MKTSIAFFIQNFSRGAGSERVTALIANELAIRGYDVSIISVCGNNTSYYDIDEKVALYTLVNKENVDNKKSFFQVIGRLKKHLQKHKVDLVIDVFAAMSVYTNLVKKKYGIKNITWEHYNYLNNMGAYWINRKIAIKLSDYLITLTETDMNYYLKDNRKLEGKIDYIFNPSPFQNVIVDEKNNFANNVLAVGRLVKLKGFHHLLDIWKIVEEKNGECDLKIVGDGEEYENLENKISSLGLKHVTLVGATREIDRYYREATILVSTSDYEGLPMTMIEGQSFGLPIVSFDYETGPKEIIHQNEDGYIVFGEDQLTKNRIMADYILGLFENKEKLQEMSLRALNSSMRFSTEAIMNKWVSTIECVLANNNK